MKYFKQIWLFLYSYHIAKASGSLSRGFLLSLAEFVSLTVPLRLSHHPHRAGGFNLFWRPVFLPPLHLLILPHSHVPRYLSADVYSAFVKHFHFLKLTKLFLSCRCSCLESAMSWNDCSDSRHVLPISSPSPTVPCLEKNLVKAEYTCPYTSAITSQSMIISYQGQKVPWI